MVGAREHNLKNITVEIPRDKLVVITGLSGSGKSSLAFDTIFAEGQRRYVESLSAYARQFLGQMDKPDVDYIEGLSPAVSIDQKGTSHNPRSTVGTVTEIYDYLRLLFARAGIPHCPVCGREVVRQSAQEIVDAIEAPAGGQPPAGPRAGGARPQGHLPGGASRRSARPASCAPAWMARCYELDEEIQHGPLQDPHHRSGGRPPGHPPAERLRKTPRPIRSRLTDSVETALKFGEGYLTVATAR